MSVPVVIQGTTINIPSSGDSPNWAPALIAFAQAVSTALSSYVGNYDVPPQIYTMTSNVNSNIALPNLSFPTSNVNGALISYSVLRTTTSTGATTVTETGELIVNYNSTNGSGLKWSISREYVGGASVTFNVTDVGQVQFSSTSITGSSHTGIISYTAKAILQTS